MGEHGCFWRLGEGQGYCVCFSIISHPLNARLTIYRPVQGKQSETLATIEQPHGVENRFKALSTNAKIGIAAGVLGFAAIVGLLVLFYFIKQRRAGRREFLAYQAAQDKENADSLEYKSPGATTRSDGYGRI
jgi:hypothetical protein